MTKRMAISGAVFALIGLTACNSRVPVHVNLAPIHATLDPSADSKAPTDRARASGAVASSAGK